MGNEIDEAIAASMSALEIEWGVQEVIRTACRPHLQQVLLAAADGDALHHERGQMFLAGLQSQRCGLVVVDLVAAFSVALIGGLFTAHEVAAPSADVVPLSRAVRMLTILIMASLAGLRATLWGLATIHVVVAFVLLMHLPRVDPIVPAADV